MLRDLGQGQFNFSNTIFLHGYTHYYAALGSGPIGDENGSLRVFAASLKFPADFSSNRGDDHAK